MNIKMKVKKKTYLLPQNLINKMKKRFKVRTETEAIIRAMKEIEFQNELIRWHERNKGKLKIDDIYGR